MSSDDKFYFNVRTREVEEGPRSQATDRLGPYDTYAEAAGALDRARERSVAWDEQDEADKEWGASPERRVVPEPAPDGSVVSGGSATGIDVEALGEEREP